MNGCVDSVDLHGAATDSCEPFFFQDRVLDAAILTAIGSIGVNANIVDGSTSVDLVWLAVGAEREWTATGSARPAALPKR